MPERQQHRIRPVFPHAPAPPRSRFLLVLATPALAEIRSADDCAAAIAADPDRAREEAAAWQRTGGGTAASLCEADALAATGAHGTAAALLTNLGQDPNRAIPADARAVILTDAATQWLAADRPDLARATLAAADGLTPARHRPPPRRRPHRRRPRRLAGRPRRPRDPHRPRARRRPSPARSSPPRSAIRTTPPPRSPRPGTPSPSPPASPRPSSRPPPPSPRPATPLPPPPSGSA